jgi:NAD+ synthase
VKYEKVSNYIIEWLHNQVKQTKQKGFVVGVSGGVDSAVTSTLCAMAGYPTTVLNLPIHQESSQFNLSNQHIDWMKHRFNNVISYTIDLSKTFDAFVETLPGSIIDNELVLANSASRLRMVSLYSIANANNYLVAGTGNKVEDYGIGFFTKYGDGGVDICPIADLLKSEVYKLAEYIEIIESIITVAPTDGLWGDNRTDESQIGASYDELEWAMDYCKTNGNDIDKDLSQRNKDVLTIYKGRHKMNRHKIKAPPVCELSSLK